MPRLFTAACPPLPATLTIVGASVRAAAMSARRAGLLPIAGDMLADEDLRQCCPATRVEQYPSGLLSVIGGPQPGEWMYTGGLENYPRLIGQMATLRPLLGNGPDVLRRVRDPRLVAAALARSGLACPAAAETAEALPRDGAWLRKPRRSAGGAHIAVWDPSCQADPADRRYYLQQRIEGTPCAAIFVAAGGRVVLLGATRQLIGAAWTGARGFCYCGSIGPLQLSAALRQNLTALGDCLAGEFALCGLFGVDFVLDGGTAWPVEINPRYTASVEILERTLNIATIGLHVDACRHQQLPDDTQMTSEHISGKAILFARQSVNIGPRLAKIVNAAGRDALKSQFADLPPAASTIAAGNPILTLMADGPDEQSVVSELQARAQFVEAEIYRTRQ